jgi:IQ calmodulin-binding motif
MSELIDATQRNCTDDDDDDDDAFLPPGFVLGETPIALDFNIPPDVLSPFGSRREFLRRSSIALDINAESVDLLGLESIEKENLESAENSRSNQCDSFWFKQSPTETLLDFQPEDLANYFETSAIASVMESKGANSFPDNNLCLKLDELAADLQADVVAGNLLMETIASPEGYNTNLNMFKVAHESTDLQQQHTPQQNTIRKLEDDINQLNTALMESRNDAIEQRERVKHLDTEVQQMALTAAAERHRMLERIHDLEKETLYLTEKLEDAAVHMEHSESLNADLMAKRDQTQTELHLALDRIQCLENEKESVTFSTVPQEAQWISDVDAAQIAVQEKEAITIQNLDLSERLKQAEDLALFVAADNDILQDRLKALQIELQAHELQKRALADALETADNEHEQKIRSLQRRLGLMEDLLHEIQFDQSITLASNDSSKTEEGAVRSLQRRLGHLMEEHEYEKEVIHGCLDIVSAEKDESIRKLQGLVNSLKSDILKQQLGWEKKEDELTEDKRKVRSLKRRIGLTESLLEDEINESSMKTNEDEGKIRNLHRRIGYLESELRTQHKKQSEYEQQRENCKELHFQLETARNSIKRFETAITELKEDLQDAYEREDEIQETFVCAMVNATSDIVKLHDTHTRVLNHLKDQYQLVEEELFDALEREEEQKENQEGLIFHYNMIVENVQHHYCSECELTREESLMRNVDSFKHCYMYLKQDFGKTLRSLNIDHAVDLQDLNESHIAQMVSLFRDSRHAMHGNDSSAVAESKTFLKPTKLECAANYGASMCANAPSELVSQNIKYTPGKSLNLDEEAIFYNIQSPRSAFVSYNSVKVRELSLKLSSAKDSSCTRSFTDNSHQPHIPYTELPVECHHDETLIDVREPQEIKIPAKSELKQSMISPKKVTHSSGKNLDFSTPKSVKGFVNNSKLICNERVLHPTPKINAAKARLRSLEASRSSLSPWTQTAVALRNGTKDSARTKTISKIGMRSIPISKLKPPSQRTGKPNIELESTTKGKEQALLSQKPPSNAVSRSGGVLQGARTLKPRLDTGLFIAPTSAKYFCKNNEVTSGSTGIPSSARVIRNIAPAGIKQKSRLPQFGSSRLSTLNGAPAQANPPRRTKSVSKPSSNRNDLFRKFSELKTTTSTPLTSRSAHSDLILSRSINTRKNSTETPIIDRVAATPQSQQSSSRKNTHLKDSHFTPLNIHAEILDKMSPESPLVTPRAMSLNQSFSPPEITLPPQKMDTLSPFSQTRVDAVVTIQAIVRGYLMYCNVKLQARQKTAAVIIQRFARNWRRLKASVHLQRLARRYLKMKKICLSRKFDAAIVIQSFWRLTITRSSYIRFRRSTICIQAASRLMLARLRAVKDEESLWIASATTIQCCWRTKRCRSVYLAVYRVATITQTIYRGFLGRQIAKERGFAIKSALYIQAKARMRQQRIRYQKMCTSAIVIQQHFRSCTLQTQVRRHYQLAIVQIQSTWRARLCRKSHLESIRRLKLIQFLWRRKQARAKVANLKTQLHAIRTLQIFARRIILVQRSVAVRHAQDQSARQLQCFCRMKLSQNRFYKSIFSIRTIQSYVRRKNAIKMLSTLRIGVKAALRIQSTWRMKRCRITLLAEKVAVTRMQKTWRMKRHRNQLLQSIRSICIIQSHVRRSLAQKILLRLCTEKKAATQIQKTWRRKHCRNLFLKSVCSIRTIQSQIRRCAVLHAQVQAARRLQCFWRMKLSRNRFYKSIFSIRTIQSYVRRKNAMKMLSMLRIGVKAAIGIQSTWRIKRCRIMLLAEKVAVTRIQKTWRMKRHRNQLLQSTRSICIIQSHVRRSLAQKILLRLCTEKKAATQIQKTWRRTHYRNLFWKSVCSVRTIQSHIRRRAACMIFSKLCAEWKAAVRIQSTLHGVVVRGVYLSYISDRGTVALQTAYHGVLARGLVAAIKKYIASARIQRFIRMVHVRDQYRYLVFASVLVQASVRGLLARLKVRSKITAVVLIQKQWRRVTFQRSFNQTRRAALLVQRFIKSYLARRAVKQTRENIVLCEPIDGGNNSKRVEKSVDFVSVLHSTHVAVKKPNRTAFGNIPLHEAKKKIPIVGNGSNKRIKFGKESTCIPTEEYVSTLYKNGNDENVRPSRNCKMNQTALAAEGLAIALKTACESSTPNSRDNHHVVKIDEVEKLKVVDLRQELKSYGLESKVYNKLRKAELVVLVVQQREVSTLNRK